MACQNLLENQKDKRNSNQIRKLCIWQGHLTSPSASPLLFLRFFPLCFCCRNKKEKLIYEKEVTTFFVLWEKPGRGGGGRGARISFPFSCLSNKHVLDGLQHRNCSIFLIWLFECKIYFYHWNNCFRLIHKLLGTIRSQVSECLSAQHLGQ